MPSGHTERATINARRPLNERQETILMTIWMHEDKEEEAVRWCDCSMSMKNTIRSLFDRGYVRFKHDDSWVGILQTTAAGAEYIKSMRR